MTGTNEDMTHTLKLHFHTYHLHEVLEILLYFPIIFLHFAFNFPSFSEFFEFCQVFESCLSSQSVKARAAATIWHHLVAGNFKPSPRPRGPPAACAASVTLPNRTVRNQNRYAIFIASTPKNHKPDYSSPCLSTLLYTAHHKSKGSQIQSIDVTFNLKHSWIRNPFQKFEISRAYWRTCKSKQTISVVG